VDQLDDGGGGAQIAPIAADRLRQGAHLQGHIGLDAIGESRAASVPDHPDAMGIVGHQPGIEALRQGGESRDRRQIAVHGKHAVGRDQGSVRGVDHLA